MAEQDILQNLISRSGQSQNDRSPAELDPHFFQIDPRSPSHLLAQARAQAALMRFYAHDPEHATEDWRAFFPYQDDNALLASEDGTVPPHLGLLGSFLELYRQPQNLLNALTARHRDFQFRRVLHFTPHPAQPDHAHVVVELKKGTAPAIITTTHIFSAGKDAQGIERCYQPVRDTAIGHAHVSALHSVYRNNQGLFFSPVANSADGLGSPFDNPAAKWHGFGTDGLPAAPIGFAVASPLLNLQEGERQISLDLALVGLDAEIHHAQSWADTFQAYLTGPKGWLGPFPLSCSLQGPQLSLQISLQTHDAAVIPYTAAIHGQAFSTQDPIIQLLLRPDASLRYTDLETLSLSNLSLRVEVEGLQKLTLENDNGSLNPKKAFQPFGPQPVVGSRFLVGSQEALSKQLTDLRLKLTWHGAPPNLLDWYHDYANRNKVMNGISARLIYQDRSGQLTSVSQDLLLRDAQGITLLSPHAPPVGPERRLPDLDDRRLFALLFSGSGIGRLLGRRRQLAQPMQNRSHIPSPSPSSGFISVVLEEDFLHIDYRRESLQHALKNDGVSLNEPYTPTIQHISLGYSAVSDTVDISLTGAAGQDSFANLDVQFFHVGCFGQAREHAFLHEQLPYSSDKLARLLPRYPNEGELLIGLSGVTAGDPVSLLFQVAEGSADPALPLPIIQWSVLCDNAWRALSPQELFLDTTRHLQASGLIGLTLPRETCSDHTWMPSGLVWLRASIPTGSAAACQLIDISANTIEVAFVDQGNDPAHLTRPLPTGSIGKLKTPFANIKTLRQPYASFGGKPEEDDRALTQRAAERLRHRQRCITAWDYERMLLDAFPAIHKIKCVPHANLMSWMAPGHVLLVVIPDLRNQNAVDPLAPCVSLDLLTRMRDYAQQYSGMQVQVHAKNPRYQRVRLDFKVRFHPAYAFNVYRSLLEQALIRVLSPWAFDSTRQIEFGGRLYRSVLLDFVEDLPYVDFATDFRMGIVTADGMLQDQAELQVDTPDSILVSDVSHRIAEVTND